MKYALALFVLAQVCTDGQSRIQVTGPLYGPTPPNVRTPRPTTTPAVWGYWLCQGGAWVAQQPFPPDGVPPREDIGLLWPTSYFTPTVTKTATVTKTPTSTRTATPTVTPTP